jgi:hypothetical protein
MVQEIKKSYKYGYIRVSHKSQEDNSFLESKIEELMEVEVLKKIFRWKLDLQLIRLKTDPFYIL